MILPAGLLLLPFVLAQVGFWDCMTGTELDNLGFFDRVSCCYSKSRLPDDYDYEEEEDEPQCDNPPQYRLSTGCAPGSSIKCWPSKGGIYILNDVHIVQRQFLGLDRFVTSLPRPEASKEVEDAFCNQVRKLGARWWEYMERYWDYDIEYRPGRDKHVLYIGWPASGGVWALHANEWDASDNGTGVIYNSISMEEQYVTTMAAKLAVLINAEACKTGILLADIANLINISCTTATKLQITHDEALLGAQLKSCPKAKPRRLRTHPKAPPEELHGLVGAGVVAAEDEGIMLVPLKDPKGSPPHRLTSQRTLPQPQQLRLNRRRRLLQTHQDRLVEGEAGEGRGRGSEVALGTAPLELRSQAQRDDSAATSQSKPMMQLQKLPH
ncbi:hypothetical protein TARUN_8449 [Trichoderma arundinaceum]|uniref:Uncharacterized protein n=1 Tax=Trichoderma arundinaceum TaxID=490622 RepID=A0A395NDJ1_TRIAR|nr:hypothetical protein TARUN_8449 [Trichoderma arundinaceum]